jgi:iron complex outermembrane receptor protein
LRRAVPVGLASALNIALGGEYRHETYAIDAGEYGSYSYGGTQGYQGFSPDNRTRAHRGVAAAYLDLSAELLPHWQVDLAGRYEHYSDVGDTETGKISTRYDATSWLALRGTVSNGFRAPTLAQEHFVSIVTAPTYANAQLAVSSVGARALGAAPLKPEKSTNFSAGLVLKPLPGLNITVDAYQIRVRDRIIDGGVYNGVTALNALALQGVTLQSGLTPDSVSAQFFANGVNTRTRGLDIAAHYLTQLGPKSAINWDVAANISSTRVTHVGLDQNGNPLLNAQGIAYLTSAYPASKIVFGGRWTQERWDLSLHEIRYGHTESQLQYYSGPNAFSNTVFLDFVNQPRWVTNLELGYRLTPALHVAVGANNLFNAYPRASRQKPLYRRRAI